MSPVRRPFRLVIQRIAGNLGPKFRVIAYGDDPICAIADYDELGELVKALDSAIPEIALDLNAEGSVVFTGEVEMDDAQLRLLRLG
jgi:hypothetical protein